jgi:ElaB/YqjD/DUF883 family membrane-anchored ribosome-binding protein
MNLNDDATRTLDEANGRTLKEQASRIVHDVKELGSIAAAEVAAKATSVKQHGRDALHAGKERARRVEAGFEQWVGAHPFQSLLVALGVGALIGFTVRRRRAASAADDLR